jgi:hypothetical protein
MRPRPHYFQVKGQFNFCPPAAGIKAQSLFQSVWIYRTSGRLGLICILKESRTSADLEGQQLETAIGETESNIPVVSRQVNQELELAEGVGARQGGY